MMTVIVIVKKIIISGGNDGELTEADDSKGSKGAV